MPASRPRSALGKHTAQVTTATNTLATTYTYDAANRLTHRAVSDGRVYTLRQAQGKLYTWSNAGQLPAERTQGVATRVFTLRQAQGRLCPYR